MIDIDAEAFEVLVGEALDSVPEPLLAALSNVVIQIEDEPEDPHLLGLYEGIPRTERDFYSFALPDRITIYRGPLTRRASSAADLARQVRVTVIHELGHHAGIDDDRLHDLGWA